jgi:hypothetical protein
MSRELKDNLSAKYYETLTQIMRMSDKYEVTHLFEACTKHADYALEKFKENPIIDFEAAEKMAAAIKELEKRWDNLGETEQRNFKAAMYYFAISEDDEPDFTSFTGFDDDVAVLNACFIYAEMDEMVIELKR